MKEKVEKLIGAAGFWNVDILECHKDSIRFFSTDSLSFDKLLKLSEVFKTTDITFESATYTYGYCDTCGGTDTGNTVTIKNFNSMISIDLYKYEELSPQAKELAKANFRPNDHIKLSIFKNARKFLAQHGIALDADTYDYFKYYRNFYVTTANLRPYLKVKLKFISLYKPDLADKKSALYSFHTAQPLTRDANQLHRKFWKIAGNAVTIINNDLKAYKASINNDRFIAKALSDLYFYKSGKLFPGDLDSV